MLLPILRLLACLPLTVLHGVGAVAGMVAYALQPRVRAKARRNLEAAGLYSRRLAWRSAAEAGKGVLETPYLWFRPPARLRGRTDASALEAAVRIQELTRSLVSHEDLPELATQPPLEVATGIHLCPLFVGVFGPDEDFTGFSAGMNNTARLQGQAKGGEILCMDTVVAAIDDARRFGPEREARVKNVEHPLRFRPLVTR